MSRPIKSLVAALAIATALAPVAQALPFGPQGPKSVEFSPDNAAEAAGHFSAAQAAALKGVHRVAIPQFQVEYVTRSQGLTRKERNQITVTYGYTPPSDAALQALTDKLYDRMAAQLTAAGFEVVPRETLEATAGWAKLAAAGKASGSEFKSESGSGRLFVGGARPYYFYPGDQHLGTGAIGWGMGQAHMSEQAIANELNAALVTVRIVVGIRETDKHSQMFALVRTASSFVGDPRITIEAPASALYVAVPGKTGGMMNPTARATFAVKDDLLFREDLMTPTLKDASGAANTAGNVASTALFAGALLANMAGGGVGMKLYKSYRFEAQPAEPDYIAAVDRNLSGVEDAMVAQFQAAAN